MIKKKFIDYVEIYCKSGDGGNGIIHFRKKKFIPKGGPDGGNGGKGGDIIFIGNKNLWTLYDLKYKKHYFADNGNNGGNNCKKGKNGENIIIQVPIGTIVKDIENNKFFEITNEKEKKILFNGGIGGVGNFFFKNSVNRTPVYSTNGKSGSKGLISLELKILANIGLIGAPNTGKSTLLSIITNSKSKVSNYPFTTINPHLGILNYLNNNIIIADIPGIIKGASHGKGLGIQFLKHIERSEILLIFISSDSLNPINEYNIILNELSKYNTLLLKKKRLLIISKSDLLDYDNKIYLKNNFNKTKENFIFISSIKNKGIENLKILILKMFNN